MTPPTARSARRPRRSARRRVLRDVGLRDDADELAVLLDDRQAANLVLRHQPQRLVEILIRIDRHEPRRRDLAHGRRLRILALRDDADRDVAVGERADQLLPLDDRREARRPRRASSSPRTATVLSGSIEHGLLVIRSRMVFAMTPPRLSFSSLAITRRRACQNDPRARALAAADVRGRAVGLPGLQGRGQPHVRVAAGERSRRADA